VGPQRWPDCTGTEPFRLSPEVTRRQHRSVELTRVVIWTVALIVVATAAGCGGGTDGESPADGEEVAGPKPRIRLVAEQSYCQANPFEARILVYVTLRNVGDAAGEVDAVPVRRYSDASVNDSVLDTMTMAVPAKQTKRFFAEFDYNAEEHDLIECGLRFGPGSAPSPINVRPPG
jgi:hypothetical protein